MFSQIENPCITCSAGSASLADGGFLQWLLPRLPGPAALAAGRAPRLPPAQLAALDRLGRPDRESATLLAAVGINADVRPAARVYVTLPVRAQDRG
jgi:hypothetical protein